MIPLNKYYLSIGKSCNLKCVYCHQGDDKPTYCDSVVPNDPKEAVKMFPSTGKYTIVFYGGEPLMYWDFIVQFSELIKEKNPDVLFGMPSNGTLLTVERAKKLNELGVPLTLSHDGKYFETTRRTADILKINPEPYLTLEGRSIGAVCSAINKDFYDIWDYFDEFTLTHGLPQKELVFVQLIKDVEGNTAQELLIYNDPEFERMLDRVFLNLKNNIINGKFNCHEFNQYYPAINNILDRLKHPENIGAFCNADTTNCHIDTYGNMSSCHNVSDSFGNMKDLGLKAGNYNPRKNTEKCRKCEAFIWCGGGCPVSSEDKYMSVCYTNYQQFIRLINVVGLLAEGGIIKC